MWNRLFPEQVKFDEYMADLARINKALADHKITLEAATEAARRLHNEYAGMPTIGAGLPDIKLDTGFDPEEQIIKDEDWERQHKESLDKMVEANRAKTQEMAEAWGKMASEAIGSMKGMVDAFKSGDILGGIQKLLDAILQVTKSLRTLGVFGAVGGASVGSASVGGARAGFGGALARGGPVVPGKTYMVGENGPEWFSTKRKGFVTPSSKEAQPQRVVVVPSPYFDVVVDSRAANVAAPMAGQAAVIGVSGSEARMARRSRRNLLAA